MRTLQRPSAGISGITGNTLKIVAMVAMLADHVGSIVLARVLVQQGIQEIMDPQLFGDFLTENAWIYYTYAVLKAVGRVAFPIFCFLLVQGFIHTRNVRDYLGRMLLFALVSEVPFDLGINGKVLEFGHQNVFFTLSLGLIALIGLRFAEEKKEWNIVLRVLAAVLSVGLCMGAAAVLKTDYDILGILAIAVLYLFRSKKMLSTAGACGVLLEIPAFCSLMPIYLYNGERGRGNKWLFYIFYPAHILLLYLLACAMGLGQVAINY